MSIREFLNSKLLNLSFFALSILLLGSCMLIADVSFSLVAVMALLTICIIVCWLIISYLIEHNRLMKLNKTLEGLPEQYLLGEVLPAPKNAIERQYYLAMKSISRSAIGVVEQERREKEEYFDYVESWIHEIKTPLTACSLILSNHDLSNHKNIRKLKTELKRADNLTENILYYARMRTAEKDTLIHPFSVAQTIQKAILSQMDILIAADIQIETDGDFTIYSDEKVVIFILNQFFVNSAKYCPGCHITITALSNQIVFEDNGIGIPYEEMNRITDRGFTGTNGRKLGNSTGMGLYLVNQLCKRLDISFHVESEVGIYTRFILTFPNLTKM